MANTLVKTEPPSQTAVTPGGPSLPTSGSQCEANVDVAIAQLFAPGYVLSYQNFPGIGWSMVLRYPSWPSGAALIIEGARCVDGRVELMYQPAPGFPNMPQIGG